MKRVLCMAKRQIRALLAIGMMICSVLPSGAQKISIEQFKRVKKDLLNQTPLSKDKKQATLDLLTDEKGFTFKADGKVEIQAEEGEGKLTLLTPHKTKFLVIKHPDYGQLTWKVPGKKGLKKKKHYQANLLTDKPGKEYKLSKQWVVFKVIPENAIVQVDSTMALLRDGTAQFNLPVGKHPYRVEAPFYEELADTLELTDSAKLIVPVVLQSFYSYLTVRTPISDGMIFLDGLPIGKGEATSGHLQAGDHHLLVMRGSVCYCDSVLSVRKGEKKVVELALTDLQTKTLVPRRAITPGIDPAAKDTATAVTVAAPVLASAGKAPVTITAPDSTTQIWVNREPMAFGKWEGQLELGYYLINTVKDGIESKAVELWVDDTLPVILDMSAPQASYGLLNIHSNVVGATVLVNGEVVGMTPCVVEHLPASEPCEVRLKYEGYKDAMGTVVPIGNDMVDVELKMKLE
jgi:hypothetical protein